MERKRVAIFLFVTALLILLVVFLKSADVPPPSQVADRLPQNSPTGKPTGKLTFRHPSQILNLTNWKLTLPYGPLNDATEIKQPQLADFSDNPWFIASVTQDALIFRAPVNGSTTENSEYPRSELREMTNNGRSEAGWNTAVGKHTMVLDQAITAVPRTKKQIVAGQIHDGKDDVIVIRLDHPKLYVNVDGQNQKVLDSSYRLGRKFTIKFEVEGDKTKVYYNDSSTPLYTLSKAYSGAYFKAGVYTQSNCGIEGAKFCNESNYGEVAIYNLQVYHE